QGPLHQGQGSDPGGGPAHRGAGSAGVPRRPRRCRHRVQRHPTALTPAPRRPRAHQVARRPPARPRPGPRHRPRGPGRPHRPPRLRPADGTLPPDAGEGERADGLRLGRFAKPRAGPDPDQPLRRALSPEGDTVFVHDRPVHVAAWAKRFLFRPEQLDLPVGRLSGGEQARILVARLMRDPADGLLLARPTNDPDLPPLEVLEDSLAEFPGGLVLVTHDRLMLDRVSTVIVALDGEGGAETFADYAQWEAARAARARPDRPPRPVAERPRP